MNDPATWLSYISSRLFVGAHIVEPHQQPAVCGGHIVEPHQQPAVCGGATSLSHISSRLFVGAHIIEPHQQPSPVGADAVGEDACRPPYSFGILATRITVCPAGPLVHAIVTPSLPAATTGYVPANGSPSA